MNGRQYAFATLATFVTIFLFEWFFHGIILMPTYRLTASVWRAESEMQSMFAFCMLRELLMAGVLAWIFMNFFEGPKPNMDRVIRVGMYVGLLMGLLPFGMYAHLQIPLYLAGAWLAGGTLLGILIAVVVAKVKEKVI